MKVQSVLAMAMALGMISAACGSNGTTTLLGTGGSTAAGGSSQKSGGSSGSTGGQPGTGGSNSGGNKGGDSGSGGSGGGSACPNATNVTPCGGDVVGTWTVTSGCFNISGQLDLTNLGIGCTSATVTGSLKTTGSWTATSDGKYSDKTTTTGTEQLILGPKCLEVSGTTTTCGPLASTIQSFFAYDTLDCADVAGGGCKCTGTVKQDGGLALPSGDAAASGRYTISANVLTTDGTAKYSYCVSGGKLTITPQVTSPTMTGTVVLQSGSSGGAGGSSSGGQSGSGAGGAAGGGGQTTKDGSAGSAGTTGADGAAGAGGAGLVADGPCDIYAAASTPCVAAYSTTRVMLKSYTGPLYQVRKGGGAKNTGSGGTTQDIGLTKDGYADSAAQDTFCGTDTCTFSILYDQSGKKNDLKVAPKGCYTGTASEDDYESSAVKKQVTINGHKVYALYTNPHEGYRNNKTTGLPLGNKDEGIYMVADGTHAGGACCWDFGNAGTDNCNGSVMNTLFFGTGYWGKGAGAGPWFMGDFEGGVWSGGSGPSNTTNQNNPSMNVPFAFGILKTSSGKYALKAANAQSGALATAYDGASPKNWDNKGGIILGIGGDNSNSSNGTFFEGAILSGRPTDDADAAVLKNVQSAGYGK